MARHDVQRKGGGLRPEPRFDRGTSGPPDAHPMLRAHIRLRARSHNVLAAHGNIGIPSRTRTIGRATDNVLSVRPNNIRTDPFTAFPFSGIFPA